MSHTPEPWSVSPLVTHIHVGSVALCRLFDEEGENYENHEANARRIVACVNALENVSTEWLEQNKSIVVLGSPIADRFREIEKQRDELLAALGGVINSIRMELLVRNNYELKYLPIYADQPDPTYIVKWVWEVRDQYGASVAEAHEWLYQAIDNAEVATIASVRGAA